MINHLWFYSLLPTVSALSCLFLLIKLFSKQAEMHYMLLFANLMLMNVLQAIGYPLFAYSPEIAEYIADGYLISAYFFFAHLMMFSVKLSERSVYWTAANLLYIPPVVLTILHMFGFIVESYRIEQNALMHNDGSLAFLLDIFILSSCLISVLFLWRNAKNSDYSRMLVSKNIVALFSFIPLILAFSTIVILSTTRYAIPVVVIGPLVTLYTAIAFYYTSRQKVVDLSIGLRFFIDRLKLAYLLLETHKTKSDLKVFSKAVDRQFIKEALQENDFNIQKTADYLCINHTTLRNKIKEYSLQLTDT